MTSSTSRAETTAKLHAIGGQSIPAYLERVCPHADTSSANQRFIDAAQQTIDEMLDTHNEMHDINTSEDEVPLYIKVRGKGKGKPVLFDPSRSSVAQVYELAAQQGLPEPIFTHTATGAAHLLRFVVRVRFDGLTASHAEAASSLKEGKELACSELVKLVLERNRRA